MVNVTKVNLPEKTRARLDEESNLQRVSKPHDIRDCIPLVDYTNPTKFPPYVKREYPKMPLLDGNKPITIDESGSVLVFYTAADEAEFLEMNPELAEEINRNTPDKAYADRVAEQADTIESLRAKLRAAGIEDDDKLPAARRNKLAGALKSDRGDGNGDSGTSLRETLPGNGNPLKNKN